MTIPGSANPLLLASAAAEPTAYEIERSVRFNSADSAYLSRTPASAGNRKTWTWAGWVKGSGFNSQNIISTTGTTDAEFAHIYFNSNSLLAFGTATTTILRTNAVFRDPSAWFHVVVAFDSTQATAANRVKMYVNGIEQTSFANDARSSITLNGDYGINSTQTHAIGRQNQSTAGYLNGYLADVHLVDGQALDPTSFGEFDDNGIWQPIEYTGTYGTNGFHLDFSNNSSAAALGYDAAGSNDWTVNNISVTAGVGNDSLVDVPTNGTETDTGVGGEVRGNYCTWNPLFDGGSSYGDMTLSNGNLDVSSPSAAGIAGTACALGTIGVSSGKYYFEVTINSGAYATVGVCEVTYKPNGSNEASVGTGSVVYYGSNGNIYNQATSGSAYGSSFTSGDVIGVALDLDSATNTVTFYKNGVSQGAATITLAGNVTPIVGDLAGTNVVTASANFGQRPFAYTAPSGFKALNTANLDAPLVTKPSEYMDVALYTGNGSTQTISGLEFSPDLVWGKSRSNAYDHALVDTVRGVSRAIASNLTDQEYFSPGGYLTAFNSDGFTVGAGNAFNGNSATYVAWCWDAGSSTASNPDGSITSTVRANASAGFSIVTYTGNGTAGATIGHGLNAVPEFAIFKVRNAVDSWSVFHKINSGTNGNLLLSGTNASFTSWNVWNSTAPSSSVFTLGDDTSVNTNTNDYVAYCFAPVDGYSSFGSYTGNGSTDGPFVYTGFRPKLVIIKYSSASGTDWLIYDSERDTYNVIDATLYPNGSYAENNVDALDFTSNGFKIRASTTRINANSGTFIYAAFSEVAFNFARAR